jgi:hypothetical protein
MPIKLGRLSRRSLATAAPPPTAPCEAEGRLQPGGPHRHPLLGWLLQLALASLAVRLATNKVIS